MPTDASTPSLVTIATPVAIGTMSLLRAPLMVPPCTIPITLPRSSKTGPTTNTPFVDTYVRPAEEATAQGEVPDPDDIPF